MDENRRFYYAAYLLGRAVVYGLMTRERACSRLKRFMGAEYTAAHPCAADTWADQCIRRAEVEING